MLRWLLLLNCLFIGCATAYNQKTPFVTKSNAPEKAMKSFRKGELAISQNEKADAIGHYKDALDIAPNFIDARIGLGNAYNANKNDKQGLEQFLKAIELDPTYKPKVLFVIASMQMRLEDYAGAAKHAQMLLDSDYKSQVVREKSEKIKRNALFIQEALKNPLPFDPQPLPPTINTTDSHEYLPSFSADGQQMIFTRVVRGNEDFYISIKKNDQWIPAEPIYSINTVGNEAAHTVTAAGDYIVFTACDRRDGFGSCDLYSAEKIDGKWTAPKNMGSPINTAGWDTQPSLSADGKYLFFASRRKESIGKSVDLYVCKRFEDGVWSKPVNLGEKINTAEDEASPFLHQDGKTLYFMSKGHPGMGDYDLYRVKQDKPFQWGEVENLGYPINTKDKEGALTISLDGTTGYFSRVAKQGDFFNGGKNDIFEFTMPESIRPEPVTYVKGVVVDAATRQPIEASVTLYPNDNPDDQTVIRSDNQGSFLLALASGKNYGLSVDQAGYLFYSDRFELTDPTGVLEPYVIEVPLQRIPTPAAPVAEVVPPKPIILKNVFFATGSAELQSASFTELNKLYDLLFESPDIRIQINGHTDDIGNDSDNQKLSEDRAASVKAYLVSKGISADRLDSRGYGETLPIADNTSAEGRAVNRRTEFVVL